MDLKVHETEQRAGAACQCCMDPAMFSAKWTQPILLRYYQGEADAPLAYETLHAETVGADKWSHRTV